MKVIARQNNYCYTNFSGHKPQLNKSVNQLNKITRVGAGSASKKTAVDKFFETKVGKFIKKVYCFGLDIDELLK